VRRVLGERSACLIGLGRSGMKITRYDEVEIESGEKLTVLTLLTGIPTPDEQALGHRSAARCASMSCAIPRSARSRT